MKTSREVWAVLAAVLAGLLVGCDDAGSSAASTPVKAAKQAEGVPTGNAPTIDGFEAFARRFVRAGAMQLQSAYIAENAQGKPMVRIAVSDPRCDLRKNDSLTYPVVGVAEFDLAKLADGDGGIEVTRLSGMTLTCGMRDGKWRVLKAIGKLKSQETRRKDGQLIRIPGALLDEKIGHETEVTNNEWVVDGEKAANGPKDNASDLPIAKFNEVLGEVIEQVKRGELRVGGE